MKTSFFHIVIINLLILFSSCEDNLNSPTVNPGISANKKILLEVFTSITCVNCIQANLFCDNISMLNGITANDTNVAIINYHPSFFPFDPFFQFNRVLNVEREDYYDIRFIPSGFSDGSQLPSSFSTSEWTNQINTNLAEFNEAVISLENTLDTTTRIGSIVIRVGSRRQLQNNNLKLFLIITENNIYFNGPLGSKYYNNIARQMINRSNGEPIEIIHGETSTLIMDYEIKQGIVVKNSVVIAFIQDNSNKKVLGVEKIKLN